jgi:hypothetical protein
VFTRGLTPTVGAAVVARSVVVQMLPPTGLERIVAVAGVVLGNVTVSRDVCGYVTFSGDAVTESVVAYATVTTANIDKAAIAAMNLVLPRI